VDRRRGGLGREYFGGMMSWRFPPFFMPLTPRSQPLMTSPPSIVNLNCRCCGAASCCHRHLYLVAAVDNITGATARCCGAATVAIDVSICRDRIRESISFLFCLTASLPSYLPHSVLPHPLFSSPARPPARLPICLPVRPSARPAHPHTALHSRPPSPLPSPKQQNLSRRIEDCPISEASLVTGQEKGGVGAGRDKAG